MTQPLLRKGRPHARYRYFAPVSAGLEPVLLAEVQALGLESPRQVPGGVAFEGPLEACYRANLWLRTASRVLRVVAEFDCPDQATLYRETYKVEWEKLMEPHQTLAVRVSLGRAGPGMTHSQFLALRVKDAVVDRFRHTYGKRPSVDRERPDLAVHAYLDQNRCVLSLDSSGWPLFMRGYRQGAGAAPLKETLAAGLIGLAGWRADRPFYDFLCGTGTLAIEAALLAGNRAPGLLREGFGFQRWPDFHPGAWNALLAEARAAARPIEVPIVAGDGDAAMVGAARANARRAGVEDGIRFIVREAAAFQAEAGPGLVLINPPYGERLGEQESLKPLYKTLGDVLKQHAKGMEAYIFTAQSELIKAIGLRASRRQILYNGPLECRLLRYALY
jgi:putative N6-adenine-specific DNA methylase